MLLPVRITPEGRVDWVCLAHMYHLTTSEPDAFSGVAKRMRGR